MALLRALVVTNSGLDPSQQLRGDLELLGQYVPQDALAATYATI